MQLVIGDLWGELGSADLILFPANSSVDRRGRLVMGAGCAMEAQERFPELPALIGADIRELGHGERSFLVWVPNSGDRVAFDLVTGCAIGAFQTKGAWHRPANLSLIRRACARLVEVLEDRPEFARVAMAFPGIGLGQLRREDVLPLLAVLPDNVFVYERR